MKQCTEEISTDGRISICTMTEPTNEARKIDVERVLRGMSTVATRYRERMHTLLPGAALRAAEIAES